MIVPREDCARRTRCSYLAKQNASERWWTWVRLSWDTAVGGAPFQCISSSLAASRSQLVRTMRVWRALAKQAAAQLNLAGAHAFGLRRHTTDDTVHENQVVRDLQVVPADSRLSWFEL